MAMPISITVEGANILTRTLMIFGQGAIRCHPFAYAEIEALEKNDARAFDAAFFGHIGHVVRNAARALVLSLSRGALARSPVGGPAARHYKKLAWSSASFAFFADVAMASLGGDLKRKETITGRFADVFAWMYLANATLRRFEAEGRREADRVFLDWSLEHALFRIQEGFDGIFENLDVPLVGFLLRGPCALWSRANRIGRQPSDELGSAVARALQVPGEQRDRLTSGMYFPSDPADPIGELEHALVLCHRADLVADKIKQAVREERLPRAQPIQLVAPAREKGIISAEEAELVAAAEAARERAIQVDSFTLEEYFASAVVPEERGDGVDAEVPRPERAAPGRSLATSR
jgi:acyl-CoA dehydrogenase